MDQLMLVSTSGLSMGVESTLGQMVVNMMANSITISSKDMEP